MGKPTKQDSAIQVNQAMQTWILYLHTNGLVRNQFGNFAAEEAKESHA